MIKANHKNKKADFKRARTFRKTPTKQENLVWYQLRRLHEEFGIKFRRQHPLHPYFADFACLQAKLIIEIDGYSHDVNYKRDAIRELFLQKLGFTILHFSNEDVETNLSGIRTSILAKAQELLREG